MDLVERIEDGDPRALPRLLTLIENDDPAGRVALEMLYPRTGQAHVVGITGPPGAGKSTLVASLIAAVRAHGQDVAVLAIDPSSPITGGAVLGDRIRMTGHHGDPGVFIRSMATRGRVGGLAPKASGLVHALDAAGFPVVLVETVGSGQDGIDIVALAQTIVVVQAPGFGDGVQAIKAGILEIGDLFVVNKRDLPGAPELLRYLRQTAHAIVQPDDWQIPTLPTNSVTGEGVSELWEHIAEHGRYLRDHGSWARRLQRAARAEVLNGLRLALEQQLARARTGDQLSLLVRDVANRELSPEAAISVLVATLDASARPRGSNPIGDERGG